MSNDNLERWGVQELSENETNEVNGGVFFWLAMILFLAAGVGTTIEMAGAGDDCGGTYQ